MSDVQQAIAQAEFPAKLSILFDPARYKVLYGGRGGAKSWGVARALLIIGARKATRILCAREFQTSIKDSVHKLLSDQIFAMGLQDFYEITQTAIRGKNGTEFSFAGLKNNVANIKSYEGCDIAWVEEAQTTSKMSWNVLIPTIRKEASEIWITFNPELETDETYKRFVVDPPENSIVQRVNWSDNPWFPETLRLEKDALYARDREAYNTIWEGVCRQTVDGAIFAKEMQQAEFEGRITKVPYDPVKPVMAIFDIGWADATAVWFLQFIGMETRLIRYYETTQTTISQILAKMQTFGYVYDTLYLPHDAQNKTLAANGRSIEEIVRAAGYNVRIIDRTPITDSINAARTIFPKCYFDRENTHEGLQCLRHYRYDVNADTGTFSQKPLHDNYSHGADAFRYIGLMINEPKQVKKKQINYQVSSWMS
ncbi:Bacteriophage terminase, large subunit [uncultured Caudovirales phage]|uniref:Bacteriophage terminase, large subunit n=1 Tax=uncultured Caudovirales phage TaxID=2100421 RepID=A0A6J5PAJ7_9CAUD|nr:Bacteriophage terminase, large subunit [uncultured Caudovirales phage]CAB4173388.1 Bacteriophage terminase, large subunit [uncultured Caudovirales phage]CAB4178656.1 Bacteriophage terminase, large subunit [uncultured Caudovirales phage]CAB4219483.1 Bacteriophage terminase, large subunit [uncultured Caudovirales phage]